MKTTYYLTDGHDVAESREMTEQEAADANEAAHIATAGTWSWCQYKEPAHEQTLFVPGEQS